MTIDHLVYATPDLETTIADLERRLGVRAALGGRHPGRGTWNAIIALSENSYLEVVAPDPAQAVQSRRRWFDIDAVTAPRFVTWAARVTHIERVAAEAALRGVVLGRVIAGSRETTDGVVLTWQFTDPDVVVEDGLVPFLIDWGNSPHPASSAPAGPALVSLRAEHPEPDRLERALATLGLTLPVERADQPGLIAMLSTAAGDVELR